MNFRKILEFLSLSNLRVEDEATQHNTSRKVSSPAPFSTSISMGYTITAEEKFELDAISENFKKDIAINNPSSDMLFLFSIGLVGDQNFEKRINGLNKMLRLYDNKLSTKKQTLEHWLSDCYAELGNYQKAYELFPRPKIGGTSSFSTELLLSLKFKLGLDIDSTDILTLFGPKMTKWGREHIVDVIQYLDITLNEAKKTRNNSFLSDWSVGIWSGGYQVYLGCVHSNQLDHIKVFGFGRDGKAAEFIANISREAENTAREEFGIPKVGEGWVSETELFYKLKNHFKKYEVITHGRPMWLGRQHLDIYIPDLNIAVEYQGEQHDRPIEFFGGEEAFKKSKARDAKKLKLCVKNGIKLIYVRKGYLFSELAAEIEQEVIKARKAS